MKINNLHVFLYNNKRALGPGLHHTIPFLGLRSLRHGWQVWSSVHIWALRQNLHVRPFLPTSYFRRELDWTTSQPDSFIRSKFWSFPAASQVAQTFWSWKRLQHEPLFVSYRRCYPCIPLLRVLQLGNCIVYWMQTTASPLTTPDMHCSGSWQVKRPKHKSEGWPQGERGWSQRVLSGSKVVYIWVLFWRQRQWTHSLKRFWERAQTLGCSRLLSHFVRTLEKLGNHFSHKFQV